MHFTREPIIESILSARDGFKLVLKNSKTASSTEISAEVIEIVSFAGSIFYRSQDRSKNFMLPATDFEILELKDARLVLKNISLEKSSKLQNPPKEVSSSESDSDLADDAQLDVEADQDATATANSAAQNTRLERRRERRRNRRRRHSEDKVGDDKKDLQADGSQESKDGEDSEEGAAPAQLMVIPVLNLIPPPTTLISQTLARYKEKAAAEAAEAAETPTVVVEESFNLTTFSESLDPEDLV